MSLLLALLSIFYPHTTSAQADSLTIPEGLSTFFEQYVAENYRHAGTFKADSFRVDSLSKKLIVYCNEAFSSQSFSTERVAQIRNGLRQHLPISVRDYNLIVRSNKGYPLESLVPFSTFSDNETATRIWPAHMAEPPAWVRNISRPSTPLRGLSGRHLFIWPSHGRYFEGTRWKWQRPSLYSTTEDLLTQSIVYPFLFPMLENAGAIVYSPRERDTQTTEVIIDNDKPETGGYYNENKESGRSWHTLKRITGFVQPDSTLTAGLNPFAEGTVRFVRATTDSLPSAYAIWQPSFPHEGDYAVYVSYATLGKSISDAHYTVHHAGGTTDLLVNQQIGGSTWVYLGTFHFMQGVSDKGFVMLSNESSADGIVTADAVRFGGGYGIVERASYGTSGFPRFLEAARYQAQWCGVPDSLYNTEQGRNDYNDDLRVRANMLSWLGGGSSYQPNTPGHEVPFELAVALHSDAGVLSGNNFFGTLSICTTQPPADSLSFGESGTYETAHSRLASRDLADVLKSSVVGDLQRIGFLWPARETWDRNYAETRMPHIPTAILEMLSHQNFQDMKITHDPTFKFLLARSIYKGILRYIYASHGWGEPIVQPLPISQFSAILTSQGDSVRLSWQPTIDSLEISATPSDYIVYTSCDAQGLAYDNGFLTNGRTEITLPIDAGIQYNFRVSAFNSGGESFPSETLSVYRSTRPQGHVLLVDAFTQLSAPSIVCAGDSLGLDLHHNPGVPFHSSWSFSGQQTKFTQPRADSNSGLELTGDEFRGNYFNQTALHCNAIATDGRYNVSSASVSGATHLSWQPYQLVDYFSGLSERSANALHPSAVFTESIQSKILQFCNRGGHLFVSGASIGSDMQSEEEKEFLRQALFCQYDQTDVPFDNRLSGLNTTFQLQLTHKGDFPPPAHVDELSPVSEESFCFITYANGHSAGVAAQTKAHHAAVIGFPFCSIQPDQRNDFMHALLSFLLAP